MVEASLAWSALSETLPLPGLLLGTMTILRSVRRESPAGPSALARARADRAARNESIGVAVAATLFLFLGSAFAVLCQGPVGFLIGCSGCLGCVGIAVGYQSICLMRECAGREMPVCWLPSAVLAGLGLASHESALTLWWLYAAVWFGCAAARLAPWMVDDRVWVSLEPLPSAGSSRRNSE